MIRRNLDGYNNVRKVKWTHNGVWQHPGQAVLKTLTDITPYTEYVETLKSLFDNAQGEEIEEKEIIYPPYSPENFLNDVYMSEDEYNTLVQLVSVKKNVILQGAPGVGKTFAARRLAYSMMGVQDFGKSNDDSVPSEVILTKTLLWDIARPKTADLF